MESFEDGMEGRVRKGKEAASGMDVKKKNSYTDTKRSMMRPR